MSIELRVASRSGPTGELLSGLLREMGMILRPGADAVVCYGGATEAERRGGRPVLNANAGRLDKLAELNTLQRANIRVPYHTRSVENNMEHFPMLARRLNHQGGTDIVPVFQPIEMDWRLRAGWNFFTSYVTSSTEYRLWVYRRKILGAYEKVMEHPENYRGIGRNYDNGFVFQHRPVADIPQLLMEPAAQAVNALGLDFGAVDILHTAAEPVVLEVNTAPGVASETRHGLRGLAEKIVRWEHLGYPRRSGDETGLSGRAPAPRRNRS